MQVGDVGLARVLDNVTHHSNVMEWVRVECCNGADVVMGTW